MKSNKSSVLVFFKQRKNKQFKYQPKYTKSETDHIGKEFQSKWQDLKNTRKRKGSIFSSPIILAFFLIAILVLIYVLGRYE